MFKEYRDLSLVEKVKVLKTAGEIIVNEKLFYAFDDEQFEKGLKKIDYQTGEELYSIGNGGYGRKEDLDGLSYITKVFSEYDKKVLQNRDIFRKRAFRAAINIEAAYNYTPFKDTVEDLGLSEKDLEKWQVDIIKEAIDYCYQKEIEEFEKKA